MRGYAASICLMVFCLGLPFGYAQRIGIETNEKHNVATSERRIKGSPVATMEVAGVKIVYPQVAVNQFAIMQNARG